MPKYIEYNISQLRPYINWLYFYFAWGLSGKPQEEKDKLKAEKVNHQFNVMSCKT